MWNFTHLFPLDVPGTVHPGQSETTPERAESNERPLPWDVRAPIEHKRTGKRLNKGSVIDELVSPVLFRWHGASEHHGVGCCTNLGLGGIFVIASECPAKGVQVCLEVLIRAFDPVGGLRLKCSGHVVRIQAGDEVSGFAVAGRFKDEIARKIYAGRS